MVLSNKDKNSTRGMASHSFPWWINVQSTQYANSPIKLKKRVIV